MSLDTADMIRRMIVPAAVVAVLGLLRRYLPARKTDPQAALDPNPILEDFSSTNWAVYTSMIVVGIAFAIFVHWALVTANRQFAEADGPATFRLLPSSAIWWFFPGFGALCLSWEITLFLWSRFEDRNRIARFIEWTHRRGGFDSTRALRWMALLIGMPIAVATILAIPLHSTLRDTDIVVGHYATLARQVFPYSQARRLMMVNGFRNRDGSISAKAEIIIEFKDGPRWHSADNRDFKSAVDPGLDEFLQRKTGIPLERAETEADLRAQPR
jgi:hypothetical protein